jgi:surfeit locus 1 family protein
VPDHEANNTMLRRLRDAHLLLPATLVLAALAVLIGLGTWQLQRKAWKDGIIASLKDGISRPPIPYADWLKSAVIKPGASSRLVVDGPEFIRVEASGRFQHEHESYAYTVRDGRAGYALFTPLVLPDGRIVVVNRGFVPQELREPEKRPQTLPPGIVTIRGMTRKPAVPNFFTPANDATRRISFSGSAGLHPKSGTEQSPSGIYIEAEPAPASTDWPKPRRPDALLATIPNRHLEYALTWFGLAATLIGVFMAFTVGRLRGQSPAVRPAAPPSDPPKP